MTQQELIRRLKEYMPQVRKAEKVEHLYLFGSYSREEQTDASDIDLVIDFRDGTKATLLDLIAIKNDIEERFGKKIELFTQRSLSKYIREDVMNNAIKVF